MSLTSKEAAARLTVIEKRLTDLAFLIEQLRKDLLEPLDVRDYI